MGYARGLYSPPEFPFTGAKALSAATTLNGQDAGKLVLFDSTTSFTVTLPKSSAATKGRIYAFQLKQIGATTGHVVAPQTGDTLHFKGGSTATASSTARCTAATAAVGDTIAFVDNGDGNFYAYIVLGTWARV